MALSVALARAQALPGSLAQWSPDFPRVDRFSNRDRPISGFSNIAPQPGGVRFVVASPRHYGDAALTRPTSASHRV